MQQSRMFTLAGVHKLTGSTDQTDEQSIKQGSSFPGPAGRRHRATSQRRRARITTALT